MSSKSTQMWSPTKARLNRSRNKQAKLQLDLSAHIKGENPLDSPTKKSEDNDLALQKKVESTIATLPKETQQLLKIIRNENNTYSVKERVEAEVALNKDPDTAQLMRDMKYIDGRSALLNLKEKTEAEQAEIMENLIKEETLREKQEKAEFKANRQAKIKEEKDRQARQKKAQSQALKQASSKRAKDASELTKIALDTKAKVQSKIDKKAKEERQHEKHKSKVLANEDSDVIRTLKEARLDQKDTKY